eukprot:811733-Prymnesium_polylepis.2
MSCTVKVYVAPGRSTSARMTRSGKLGPVDTRLRSVKSTTAELSCNRSLLLGLNSAPEVLAGLVIDTTGGLPGVT